MGCATEVQKSSKQNSPTVSAATCSSPHLGHSLLDFRNPSYWRLKIPSAVGKGKSVIWNYSPIFHILPARSYCSSPHYSTPLLLLGNWPILWKAKTISLITHSTLYSAWLLKLVSEVHLQKDSWSYISWSYFKLKSVNSMKLQIK